MCINKTVGKRIRIARAMAEPPLAQIDLLAKLQLANMEISQSTLSKIESGQRSISVEELEIIATTLNVDMLWLLGRTEIKF